MAEAAGVFDPCPHCAEIHPEKVLRCPAVDRLLPLRGRLIEGKYRLLDEIGSGGMASVWSARNEAIDREVAIKLLRPEVTRSDEAMSRFRSEARAAGRIGNPHICEILDLGDSPIGPFIVMERLQGEDLHDLIEREGPLPPARIVHIVREALEALAAAHESGIVHRDLKPGNVFLHEPEPGRTEVKLMDFGVSKFRDRREGKELTGNIVLGTPEYMAPEQVGGAANVDQRADVYSMGAMLYRALTGETVYSGDTVEAVLMQMARESPLPLAARAPDLPSRLCEIVDRCLARDPADRFPTAADLSAALVEFDDTLVGPSVIAAAAPARAPGSERGRSTPTPTPGPGPAPAPTRKSPGRVVGVLGALGVVAVAAVLVALRRDRPQEVAAAPPPDMEDDSDDGTEPAPVPAPPAPVVAPVPAGRADTDTGAAPGGGTPPQPLLGIPPSPPREEAVLVIEDDGAPTHGATRRPEEDPSGTVRVANLLALTAEGPSTGQVQAKLHCEKLARARHLGIDDWHLANPTELQRFAGNARIRRGSYWTSAMWRGRAVMIALPGGRQSSRPIDRHARPLCVSK